MMRHNVMSHNVMRHNVMSHNVMSHNVMRHNVMSHNVMNSIRLKSSDLYSAGRFVGNIINLLPTPLTYFLLITNLTHFFQCIYYFTSLHVSST
jgi:hypothetical protein